MMYRSSPAAPWRKPKCGRTSQCGRGHQSSHRGAGAFWRLPAKMAARSGITAPFTRSRTRPHSMVQAANGVDWYRMEPAAQAPDFEVGEQALAYNQASFQNFMPGFEQQVTTVDGSHREEGHFEVRIPTAPAPSSSTPPVRRPTGRLQGLRRRQRTTMVRHPRRARGGTQACVSGWQGRLRGG